MSPLVYVTKICTQCRQPFECEQRYMHSFNRCDKCRDAREQLRIGAKREAILRRMNELLAKMHGGEFAIK